MIGRNIMIKMITQYEILIISQPDYKKYKLQSTHTYLVFVDVFVLGLSKKSLVQ